MQSDLMNSFLFSTRSCGMQVFTPRSACTVYFRYNQVVLLKLFVPQSGGIFSFHKQNQRIVKFLKCSKHWLYNLFQLDFRSALIYLCDHVRGTFVFLQPCLNNRQVQSYQDDSYVPMASSSPSVTSVQCDSYIPMSPRTFSFLSTNGSAESSSSLSSPTCQPGDPAPPPIHRHLKPRLRRGENRISPEQPVRTFF